MVHFTQAQRESWQEGTRNSGFNRWLRDQVNRRDGTLNLERLYDVARQYGLDGAAAYGHLNRGQQRMNIGNRLRTLVPPSVYSHYDQNPRTQEQLKPAPDSVGEDRSETQLSRLTALELMRMHGAAIDELRRRRICRTGNSPLGDYAEHLFAKSFGWKLEGNSTAGHDAIDSKGVRYQVKTRRVASGARGERQLSVFRQLPDAKFDVLAAVLLDREYEVFRAALVPFAIVLSRSTPVHHVNGWRFFLDDEVWALAGVVDVTATLRVAVAAGG